MASMPCAYCYRVPKARLYTMIWAWYHADGDRVAYKTRACSACYMEAATSFGDPLPEDGEYIQLPTSCVLCSDPIDSRSLALTYLTYWDGDGEHRPIFGVCDRCGNERHVQVQRVGEAMPDRPQNRRRAA